MSDIRIVSTGSPLRVETATRLSEDQLYEISRANPWHRVERGSKEEHFTITAMGEWEVPRIISLVHSLATWAENDGTGLAFSPATGFILPNSAIRFPAAAWLKRERWQALPPEMRSKFVRICPDFVVEVRAAVDGIEFMRHKLEEYMRNGTQLAWLIDPFGYQVHVYRTEFSPETLNDPLEIRGEPLLPGFTMRTSLFWSR